MRFEKRLKTLLFSLTGVAFLLTLLAVVFQDSGSRESLNDLSERLGKAELERRDALMAEKGSDALKLLAEQVKARREDFEDAAVKMAGDSSLLALFASGKAVTGKSSANAKGKP